MRKKIEIIIGIAFAFMMLYLILFIALGESMNPGESRVFYEDYVELKDATLECGAGTDKVTIPFTLTKVNEKYSKYKGKFSYSIALPKDNTDGKWIMLWNHGNDFKAYVDDTEFYDYNTDNSRFLGDSSPYSYIFMKLPEGAAGKTLRIEINKPFSYAVDKVFIGDKGDMFLSVFKPFVVENLLGIILIVFSVGCFFASIILRIYTKHSLNLHYMSLGVFVTAIWILTNSASRQFYFPIVSVVRDAAYISVSVLSMPFLIYINRVQKKRYFALFTVVEAITFAGFLAVNITYWLGASTLHKLFVITEIVSGLVITTILGTIVYDIIKKRIRDYLLSAMSMGAICIAGVIQIILYILMNERLYTGIVIEIGLFFTLVFAISAAYKNYVVINSEKEAAIRASEAKAQFLANMSHEIRTPINAVLGMNEMILREEKNPQILSYSRDINSAGKTLLSLINDILDFSKIESGRMELINVQYEITSLLNDIYNMIIRRASDKGLKLSFSCNEEVPKRLLGDETRVRQMMINLLTNAVKYTDKGEVKLRLDYEMIDLFSLKLIISVEDTGRGIKKENIDKLFASFQRVDEANNRNIEGTGLGLSITQSFVNMMNGKMSVTSEYGKGSTFTIEIPQDIVSDEPVGKWNFDELSKETMAEKYKPLFKAKDARVLVVDDVKVNLGVFKGLLKHTEVAVDTAESGRECIRKCEEIKYDIIFLDHMMPDMDGIETFNELKNDKNSLNRETPVIMLTANAISGTREKYLDMGFADYLSKPIVSEKLERKMIKFIPEHLVTYDFDEKEDEDGVGSVDEAVEETGWLAKAKEFLDTDKGIDFCGDVEDFYFKMLKDYANEPSDEQLCHYYDEGDWEAYEVRVHGLKTSSLIIGAIELSDMARALEIEVHAGNFGRIPQMHKRFIREYRSIIGKILELTEEG